MTRLVSVSELTTHIRVLFEADDLLRDIGIEGEVTQVFTSQAGHIYFTLSDGSAKLKCVMFRGQAARARTTLVVGLTVSAFGRVTVYERDTTYQLYVDAVFDSGIGVQAIELERMRLRLEADGLFEISRKRSLPAIPGVIGVVTSAQGAVWHDIQTVVERRFPLAELLLSPAQVQGAGAEASLVAALRRLIDSGRADVIIVARGGGSVEDLAAFNGEAIARAVFASPVPVVSAIGHETDWSILDDVADLRAPTPTAAAELVTPNQLDLLRAVLADRLRIEHHTWAAIGRETTVVDALRARTRAAEPFGAAKDALDRTRRSLTSIRVGVRARVTAERVATTTARRLIHARRAAITERPRLLLAPLDHRLGAATTRSHDEHAHGLSLLCAGLERLNPMAVLDRGYAVVTDDVDRLVSEVGATQPGRTINVRLADGHLQSTVTAVTAVTTR